MNYKTSISGTLNTGQNLVNGTFKSFENPCAVAYLFGFNGKENDNEVKGPGNQQDYGMRIYDPRLGRFLSADPLIVQGKKYPWYSPYQFAGNKPIWAVDLDGLEEKKPEVRTNVIIVLESSEIVSEKIKSGTHTYAMGTFQVFYASSIMDANSRLSNYMQNNNIDAIDNLVIRTHGNTNGGQIDLDPSTKFNIDGTSVGVYNNNPSNVNTKISLKPDAYNQVKALDEIADNVKKDGNLVITSCYAGNNMEGVILGQQLNILTGGRLNIFLNQDKSTRISSGGNLQVFTRGGLTDPKDLINGWIKVLPDGTQKVLKDASKGKTGNLKIDSRPGQEAIQEQ